MGIMRWVGLSLTRGEPLGLDGIDIPLLPPQLERKLINSETSRHKPSISLLYIPRLRPGIFFPRLVTTRMGR